MRLAASNIAWSPQDRLAVYDRMAALGYRGLEVAPALFLWGASDPFCPEEPIVARAIGEARERGLELVSMQALLFGAGDVALFGAPAERAAFASAMRRAIELGGRLGIPNLVFGAPRQRVVPEGMTAAEATKIASDVFGALGDRAVAVGTRVSIEANPPAYGGNFWTTLPETFSFLDDMDHPGLVATLDLGTLRMTGAVEGMARLIAENLGRIGHAHASAPMLGAPSDDAASSSIGPFLTALSQAGYPGWVSLEMRSDEGAAAHDASLVLLAAGGRT